ncbi:zinc/cadmium/mercury/lead-transporting ATPase [Vibrio cincinnatiensis]|uniref:zinc/cadmium/mercury/lead-transporting ATPase n=1 Tax=Vibrio cincinnatiensis TaxID=675 RepID=UPI001EDD8113|nr:zinc/cadmium/mercury/lead-transporting ATPase [Vibrio cincinnatiensis]MCG3724755.1 zinc/cadmium/mercury/lead-transporting ATPase [Vibrio cincinnatiensis]
MCVKHQGCCSAQSSHSHLVSCCSSTSNTASVPIANVSDAERRHCHDAGCGDGSPPEEEEPIISNAQYQQSWQISGMDCPSCARKIETALQKVSDIVDAKVLFATQKLVVNFNQVETAVAVEQAVMNAGFVIQSPHNRSSDEEQNPEPWLLQSDNLRIVIISAAMGVGAIVSQWSSEWAMWIFTLTCLLGLFPIARKAGQLAKSGTPFAIETLMTVAALGALYLGETAEAAMVLLLFLIGERLEGIAASRARSGVQALMALVPERATKIDEQGLRILVSAQQLQPGDKVEVAPGGRLPADGILLEPVASFDESALTGESIPIERQQGEVLFAGSLVVDRVIQMTITSKVGENAIDRILHLIEEAESRKAPLERFLDKFSRWYTPLMMGVALLVVILPPLLFAQPWETWTYRGLALLLIACPCALVISTPAAITSGLAAGARRGVLIKGGAALEQLGRVEVMAFDKTGTLTEGKPHVTDIIDLTASDFEWLSALAAIEQGSTHPLATSLVEDVQRRGYSISEATDKKALVGRGMTGVVEGQPYSLLSPSKIEGVLDYSLQAKIESLESEGKTLAIALKGKEAIGIIAWQDTLREDAQVAITQLKKLGIDSIMLTGDNARSAAAMAQTLSMDYQAGLLPQDKVTFIEQLSQQRAVAMVGDGINDAPAMKQASIGIAMGGGTDVALETADAALTHNRLLELSGMIQLSRATLNNIRQNVTLALGLKGIFLVTSLLGITGLWVAVLADSGATALVTLNALRLLRFKP